MKKLFALALVAIAASGCGGTLSSYRFNAFPTVYVEVVNSCFASTVFIKSPGGKEMPVRYGESSTAILERNFGSRDSQVVLTARGIGNDGTYLGSSSRTFYTGYSGGRQDSWQITYLQGGVRSCSPPRRP